MEPKMRALFSAIVITKNESARIEKCLESLKFADERLVVDSGSTDSTVAQSRAAGARVIETDWPGFGAQKNRAVDAARHDWLFSIDADEWVDDTLAQAIQAVLAQGTEFSAYRVSRLNQYRGKAIYHGNFGRDRPIRLFRKSAGRFSDVPVHESVLVSGNIGLLPGWLHHDTIRSYAEGLQKSSEYARLSALRLASAGKGGWFSGLGHGAFAFIREFVLRAGFLDGLRGLELAWFTGRYTFLKYYWARRV
jgi:glycosyltransferase involved in cell wall biosynthesis